MIRTLATLALCATATASAAQELSVADISRYLDGLTAAQARFVQANPDKTLAQGVLYLQKPGRIRYEYQVPDDSLVISDGRYLGIFDTKSNRGPQRYDLRRTPLDILLGSDVDLRTSGVVRDVQSDGTQTRVVAQDPSNPGNGTLTMVFTANPTELRQWIITDRSGKATTVILSDFSPQSRLNPDLFDISKAAGQ